ncbi:MAG: c-type cytochrome [Planctomycetaceae bacterium]|nr:c-type cytochrome [Planctomycetaceae bacterium]
MRCSSHTKGRSQLRLLAAAALLAAWPARVPAQSVAPDEAVARMKLADGVTVNCFASEPMIRQPVAMTFDDRGRLWVVQYLQYPNPAGLKRVQVDRYSRTIYDRVPEPPPQGPRGADRVTILEDTDGDGRADTAKDFVDGLNLASSLALGYGGVFVLQVPYLLFYPDANGDDLPDGDPEVLVRGFGMEDAHSVANSLTWGPDGWLYGSQGSTVTAHIQDVSFQQGIWRYHPRTRKFELFAEGGGNNWGVDFDAHGELIAGTNVGPYAMLHPQQGGFYWKSFGKHGELHNPHAFGYIDHIPYTGFVGGHVTCGGIVYQSEGLPDRFRGRYLAANLLSHAIHWHELEPRGSSFVGRHGGELLVANDPWFAPVDLCVAPDGALFVCDWHDERTAHPDPDAEWDRSNGRIYRLQGVGAVPQPAENLRLRNLTQSVELLESSSGYHRATARRLIAERRGKLDSGVLQLLEHKFQQAASADLALEYLWAISTSGGLDERIALLGLAHRDAEVRGWTVRLLTDESDVTPGPLADRFLELASSDPSPVVRSRLASAAQRLPGAIALPVIGALMQRDEDLADQQLPLLIWWGLERHAEDRGEAIRLFENPAVWRSRLAREEIAPRLARRLSATRSDADYAAAARLSGFAEAAGDRDAQSRLLAGISAGLRGRRFAEPPPPLVDLVRRTWEARATLPAAIELALRTGYPPAQQWARGQLERAEQPGTVGEGDLRRLMALVAETGTAASYAEPCLALLRQPDAPLPVRHAALAALGAWSEPAIAGELLAIYPPQPAELRDAIRDVLVSRADSAALLVDAVRQQAVAAGDVSTAQLRRMAEHRNAALDDRIRRLWGQVREGTPEERLAVVRRLNNDLRAAPGDAAAGQRLFREHCGSCHRLFHEGISLGPDLTSANRQDRDYLLVSIVDPSAHVRKEFMNYVCHTTDGRVLTGLVVEESPAGVTLLDAKNQRTAVERDRIAELEPAPQSLMPEGILEKLTPSQLRDLFAFVQAEQAPLAVEPSPRAN